MKRTTKKETPFHAGKQMNEVSNKEKEATFSRKVYHKKTRLSRFDVRYFLETVIIFVMILLVIALVLLWITCAGTAIYLILKELLRAMRTLGGVI